MYRQKGKRVISVLISALAAILILAGCATSQQQAVNKPSGGEAKANAAQTSTADEGLYQQRCSVCHSALDPKDPTNLNNFERMADVAKLTPSEKETLLSYIKKSQKE